MTTELYRERKASGLCPYCGKLDDRIRSGRIFCKECNDKRNETRGWLKNRLKKKGACITCGEKNDRIAWGYGECSHCAQVRAVKMKAWKERRKAVTG